VWFVIGCIHSTLGWSHTPKPVQADAFPVPNSAAVYNLALNTDPVFFSLLQAIQEALETAAVNAEAQMLRPAKPSPAAVTVSDDEDEGITEDETHETAYVVSNEPKDLNDSHQ
jgi:hypothetical protein